MKQSKNTFPAERLVTLSDAVFAIAMTIMVLELKFPELPSSASNDMLLARLVDLIPVLGAYVLSFSVLAAMWRSYATIPRLRGEWSKGASHANLIFLFFICLIPFPTNLLQHFGIQSPIPVLIFGATLLGANISLGVLRYLVYKSDGTTKSSVLYRQRMRIYLTALFTTIGIAITFTSLYTAQPQSETLSTYGYAIIVFASFISKHVSLRLPAH